MTSMKSCFILEMGLERGFFFQADDFSQHELVLRLCDELEPMLIRVHGDISSKTVELMKYKANAHRDLDRFNEARAVAAQSLKFSEKLSGRSEGYIEGLNTLASISYFERDFEGALKLVEEARALFKPEYDSGILAMLLNLHSNILTSMGRYQDALIAREKNTEMCLRLDGPNHPNYATNCLCILNSSKRERRSILQLNLFRFARKLLGRLILRLKWRGLYFRCIRELSRILM